MQSGKSSAEFRAEVAGSWVLRQGGGTYILVSSVIGYKELNLGVKTIPERLS